jgi:hypothetical protein
MPRATTTRKPRTTRTRKDVAESFETLAAGQDNQEALDPQAAQLASEQATNIRSKVKGLSIDAIVQSAATLNLTIGRTLNDLTEQCVARAQELKDLQAAIEIEGNELERLYGLDIASAAIQLLIEEHAEKKEQLEKEMLTARVAWNEELQAHEKSARQRDLDLQVNRKREEDTYEYNKRVLRGQKEDDFARKMATQERELSDKATAFDKDYTDRRLALEAQEADVAALRARVAGLDEEINKAVAKAEKILSNILTKDNDHKTALLTAEWSSKLSLEQQRSANFEKNNTELAKQVLALTQEVKEAHAKVAETAKEALASASGQTALAKVMEMQSNGSQQRAGGKS